MGVDPYPFARSIEVIERERNIQAVRGLENSMALWCLKVGPTEFRGPDSVRALKRCQQRDNLPESHMLLLRTLRSECGMGPMLWVLPAHIPGITVGTRRARADTGWMDPRFDHGKIASILLDPPADHPLLQVEKEVYRGPMREAFASGADICGLAFQPFPGARAARALVAAFPRRGVTLGSEHAFLRAGPARIMALRSLLEIAGWITHEQTGPDDIDE